MNIGLDVGYSEIKVVAGADSGAWRHFPSAVGTPDKGRFSLNSDASFILLEPEHVQVGQAAIAQSRFLHRREDRRWIDSPEWLTLALAALTETTKATRAELRIVTGLPVSFYADKDRVRDRLLGLHRVQREERNAQRFDVVDCRVIPQPFGCLLAASLSDSGRIVNRDLATGPTGIIDIGGKTTNLLSVSQLAEIGRETASVNAGSWDAMRAMRSYLDDHYPNLELRDHQVMDAIVKREVYYYKDRVDLADAVNDILEPLARKVLAEATQLWNGGAGLRAILVSGGGALLLGAYVKEHFRHAEVVASPVFANALGYWRFAQRLGIKK